MEKLLVSKVSTQLSEEIIHILDELDSERTIGSITKAELKEIIKKYLKKKIKEKKHV